MKVKFEITYNAEKLAKQMPKMIRTYMNDAIVSLQKGSKDAIKSGKFDSLGEFTKYAREKGLSPNSGHKKTSSTKPLRHTGNLFRSVKAFKRDKSLEFMEYGFYHTGIDENLDTTLDDFKSKAGKGSGIAYKVAKNKFSSRFGIVGKNVPVRNWLQFDKKINTIKKEFFDSLDKNFKK